MSRKRNKPPAQEATPARAPAAAAPAGGPAAHGAPRRLGPLAIALILLGLTFFSVKTRVDEARPIVFPRDGAVRLLDTDSYAHLRHTRFAVHNFPRLARYDIGTHYPIGEVAEHTGLFNLSIAAVALIAGGGSPDELTIEEVSAWAPIALHAASLLALFALVFAMRGPRWALAACAMYTFYPGLALERTMLGDGDHHAAEILLMLLCALGLLRALVRPPRGGRFMPDFVRALPLVALTLTWVGAPLVVVVSCAAVLCLVAFEISRRTDAGPTADATLRWALGLVLPLAVLAVAWRELIPKRSLLIPIALAALGTAAAARALALMGPKLRAKLGVATGPLILLAVAAASALALHLLPGGDSMARRALAPRTYLVQEHGGVAMGQLLVLHGATVVLAAFAIPLALHRAWRDEQRRFELLPLIFAALVVAASKQTGDFQYYLGALFALLGAYAVSVADGRWIASRPALRYLTGAAIFCALAVPLLLGRVRSPLPDREGIAFARIANDGWVESMAWLRAATPEPGYDADKPVAPWPAGSSPFPAGSWGVIAPWDSSSIVAALGDRTPIWSHGISRRSMAFFFADDEVRAAQHLCPRCGPGQSVRYAIVDARLLGEGFLGYATAAGASIAPFTGSLGTHRIGPKVYDLRTLGDAYLRTMAGRLYLRDGRGLGKYRLVYESPHQSFLSYVATEPSEGRMQMLRRSFPIDSEDDARRFRALIDAKVTKTPDGLFYGGEITSTVKIFEVVPGARIRGKTLPNAEVVGELALRAGASKREVHYENTARATADGSYELIVPYATRGPSGDLTPLGDLTLSVTRPDGTRSATVADVRIRPSDVEKGEVVEIPPMMW